MATALFAATTVVGTFIPLDTYLDIGQGSGDFLEPLLTISPFLLFFLVFLNNAIKTLAVIGLGILLGLPPLFFIGINGFVLGSVMSWVKSINGLDYLIASTVPHGIIEIPLVLLATALSLTVGWESFKWVRRRESSVKSRLSASFKLYLKIILPGLAVAAAIEAFLTPWFIGLVGGG